MELDIIVIRLVSNFKLFWYLIELAAFLLSSFIISRKERGLLFCTVSTYLFQWQCIWLLAGLMKMPRRTKRKLPNFYSMNLKFILKFSLCVPCLHFCQNYFGILQGYAYPQTTDKRCKRFFWGSITVIQRISFYFQVFTF